MSENHRSRCQCNMHDSTTARVHFSNVMMPRSWQLSSSGADSRSAVAGYLQAARDLVDDQMQNAGPDLDLWLVHDLWLQLVESNEQATDLDPAGIAVLQGIAAEEDIGAAQAEAWLALLGEPLTEVVLLPSSTKRLKPQREPKGYMVRPLLGVYPNPSNGPVYFTYPVAEGVERVELSLHDASGRLIGNHRLAANAGIVELDRRDLPTGLVIANLYWDGIRVADAKVALVK